MTVLDTRFYNLVNFCMHSENIRFSGLEFTFLLTELCMQLTERLHYRHRTNMEHSKYLHE